MFYIPVEFRKRNRVWHYESLYIPTVLFSTRVLVPQFECPSLIVSSISLDPNSKTWIPALRCFLFMFFAILCVDFCLFVADFCRRKIWSRVSGRPRPTLRMERSWWAFWEDPEKLMGIFGTDVMIGVAAALAEFTMLQASRSQDLNYQKSLDGTVNEMRTLQYLVLARHWRIGLFSCLTLPFVLMLVMMIFLICLLLIMFAELILVICLMATMFVCMILIICLFLIGFAAVVELIVGIIQ